MAGIALVLAIVNAFLFTSNRALRDEANVQTQFIQQSVQLEGLFNEMVRALAEMSVRDNDEQLKMMLQMVGVTVSLNSSPPAPQRPAGAPR